MTERIVKRNTLSNKVATLALGACLAFATGCSDGKSGCIVNKNLGNYRVDTKVHPMKYLAKTCQYENDSRFDKYR
tara:strand:+ start:2724 stop:2948 length:225 start_codon:yes stop_codon:yes gene_type:complete